MPACGKLESFIYAGFLHSWINLSQAELILWIDSACIVCLAAIAYTIRMKCGCDSYFIRFCIVLQAGIPSFLFAVSVWFWGNR
jgi:hypothetical protein